jgi:signal transduction histidine kinase
MSAPFGTLSIRRWLALAFAVTFLAPAIAMAITGGALFGGSWHASGQAAHLLRAGAPRWNDPAWRAATRTTLAANGTVFVLRENGRNVYRSGADPLATAGANQQVIVQRVVIADTHPSKVAYVYSPSGMGWSGAGGDFRLVPLVGLATLLLTLGTIAWFLRRSLVVPLAATGDAARRIAAGDLEVDVPDSRVREVAELGASFELMSAELRSSLKRQAAVEEERGMFVSAIAHDLRTPLFSLRGHLEGLAGGMVKTPEKSAEYVRICRDRADVLERLISDLFAYARIEYLEQTLCREPFDLGALLCRTVEGRQRDAEHAGVRLQLDRPERCRTVQGDEHLLGRVLENLLDNALCYTPRGGAIRVQCRCQGDRVSFSVSDTGPGIEPLDLPHLFKPMYRADPSRSRDTGGAGLGLAIARRIMRGHGGDLIAASLPEGGAEFTATLPDTSVSPPRRG